MERRAVLKLVALAALTQKLYALPNDAMRDMESAQAAPTATAYTLQLFSEDESRLLDQLMEMIIPADDHSPGAHEAGTNLFADLMVARRYPPHPRRGRGFIPVRGAAQGLGQ
jgi:hypothetical protein